VTKKQFRQYAPLAIALSKLQRRALSRISELPIGATNANRERRSARNRVLEGHIPRRTDAMQPDTHLRLRIMDPNRALLRQVCLAQKHSF
jgi:hypothetical protein